VAECKEISQGRVGDAGPDVCDSPLWLRPRRRGLRLRNARLPVRPSIPSSTEILADPHARKDFGIFYQGKWILPSTWLALWNIASPIGAMAGSLLGSFLSDKIGRRRTLGIASLMSAIGVAVMYVSYLPADITGRRVCFMMGKLLQGLAIGAVMAATQTYMSEILPPVLRGSGMAFFPAVTLLGQLTGALVIFGALNKGKGYAVVFGSQWPFSFVPIVVAFLIPESPAWFVRKRKMHDAHAAQARLDPQGTDTRAVVAKILADIEHEETSGTSTFAECFHKRNIRRTFIVMWSNCLTAIFGLQLLAKASYFLQLINMSPSTSIIFLIIGVVTGLVANLASIWLVARVARRPLVLYSMSAAALLWLSMGIANSTPIRPAVMWWTAACMMLTVAVTGLGAWPASFAIAAETSSLQLRAKTQGIGWFVSALASTVAGLVLPYEFNPDQGNLRGKVGYVFAASTALGVLVSWYVIPEMKGRSVGEIDRMFEEGVGARDFRKWEAVEQRAVEA
jgi:MFS family permease